MSPNTLTILMLGEFQVHHGDRRLADVFTPRLQSFLAYLLLHRDSPPSRQQLAFTFWPDSTDRQARTNLRKALHRLRQVFPPLETFLDAQGPTLRWQQDAPVWLDVAEFELLLQQAQASDPQRQPQLLEAALALYKGDLLPDLYDDWLLPVREQLRLRYLDALDRLAELQEANRDYVAASQSIRRLLREAPLRERGYRRLMRLQALDGHVAAALRTYHQCAALLEHELGVEPAPATQAAYRRLLKHQAVPRQQPHSPARRQLSLVGRDQAWQELLTAWRRTVAGNAQVMLISGEAGIGKTRLAEELLAWTRRQGIAALGAACFAAEDQLPFAPVADWLRAESLRQPLSSLAPRWRGEVARVLPELLAADPQLETPRPMTESWQQQHLFMALAEAVSAAGAPLLLFLDDLHWADANTLAWLHFLMRQKSDAGLLLLATVRSEEVLPHHPLLAWQRELARTVPVHHTALAPLDASATAALASNLLNEELEAPAAEALFRATEGNPLFTVEIARAGLKQAGAALPHKVLSVIELRLSQLAPATRKLVGLAALIGRSFTFPLLAAASNLPNEEVVSGLDELWQRQIVREQGEDEYDFSHDKIRQVALEQLSTARRHWGHRRVARAMESVFTGELDAVHGQIAAHWAAAGHKQEAVDSYIRAADNASRLYAHQESIHHLQRALALLPTGDTQGAEIHAGLGEAFLVLGQVDQAAASFSEAAAAASNSLEKARLLTRRVRALSIPGGLPQVRLAYEEALNLLENTPPAERDAATWAIWLDLHLHLLRALYFGNESGEMAPISEAMVQPLEAHGTARQRAHYFAALGWMRNRILRYQVTGEDVAIKRTALQWARLTGDDGLIAFHQFGLGFTMLWGGQVAGAVAELRQAARQVDAQGNIPVQCMCYTYLSIAYRFQGNEDRVYESVQKLLPLAHSADERNYLGVAQAQQAWLALNGADNAAAVTHAHAALQYWHSVEPPYPMQWLARFPLLAIALESAPVAAQIAGMQEHARAILAPAQQRMPDPLTQALHAAVAADVPSAAAINNLQEACHIAREQRYL